MIKYIILFSFCFLFSIQHINASGNEEIEITIDSLEQLISESSDNRDNGQWYLEISIEREYLKQYAEAILQIDHAIICAEKINNYNFMAQCLVRKAYIYIRSTRDIKIRAKKISPIIKELVLIMDKVYLPITRAGIYSLQGIQVEIEHNYDDSEEMFNELIAFQRKAIEELDLQQDTIIGKDLVIDRNYKKIEIASALISWSRFDEAYIYIDQILSSKDSKSSPTASIFVKMLAYQLLSQAYFDEKKTWLVKAAVDSTLFYCNQLPGTSYDRHKANAFELDHKILYEIGEYEQAYKVHLQFTELRELDFNEAEILAQGKAESNLKMLSDSISQAQVLIDKNLKIETKKQENTWLSVGVSILLIALILVFILLRKINTSKTIIEEQNQQVNEALEEKELLLKEVHHRVKNNMQLVSSLLELQSEFAKDDFAKQVLSDGNDRIKALAFAHQKLYQNEDYENIELNDYFNQIILHLLGKADCKTTIDVPKNFVINIERGQVLGFIINELITNSLKYAWKNTNKEKLISFSMSTNNNEINFLYKDNGIGFPDDFSLGDSNSLGYTLIPSFVKRQLKGNVSCKNNDGAEIKITFPK